jgi:hypothetical protein
MPSSRSQLDKLKQTGKSKEPVKEESESLYKKALPLEARVFLETLVKNAEERKKSPITLADLTKDQQRQVLDVIKRSEARGSRGDVQYKDYSKAEAPIENTLGRFRFVRLPDGSTRVMDSYEFYNPERKSNVEFYEKTNPVMRAVTSGTAAMEELFKSRFNPVGAAAVIGEAYIGRDGRPVDIVIPPMPQEPVPAEPVKRSKGSPEEGEMPDEESRASLALKALVDAGRGFLGLEAARPGSEAYRTGQALSNMPAIGLPAAAIRGVGSAKKALDLVDAPSVMKRGKLAEVEKKILESQGELQAKRLQRAADEVPGLEDQYSAEALLRALAGTKGAPFRGVVTLDPKKFESFAAKLNDPLSKSSAENIEMLQWVLRDKKGFDEVPMLMLDKETGRMIQVAGHEGRHRNRAMAAEELPKSIVQIVPRRALEFGGAYPEGMTSQQWRDLLNKTLDEDSRLVVAEKSRVLNPEAERVMRQIAKLEASDSPDWEKIGRLKEELAEWKKSADYTLTSPQTYEKLPEVYKKGGEVKKKDTLQFIKKSSKRR